MSFKDLFSAQAGDYAKYRPHYPEALFAYLASLCPARNAAWDVGTGNGQAALALAKHFPQIFATEPSEKQLSLAVPHDRIKFSVASAEKSGLAEFSVNLVTVAQAFHWFDQERFFQEVRRVAEPGAVLAVWCYELTSVNEDVDAVMLRLYNEILSGFWDARRKLVEEGYRNERFPFSELEPPPFEMHASWNLAEFMGYLGTWSAVAKYRKEKGVDPLSLVADEFRAAWGASGEKKKVSWPLSLRVFQVS